MNFISAFDELDKLYESVENLNEERTRSRYICNECGFETELFDEEFDGQCPNCYDHNGAFEKCEEALTEETAEDMVEDEAAVVEDEVVEDEVVNKPIVLECSKCGALVIKDESEVTFEEESGLANVEEECAYCEETEGFKAIGTFEPYVTETAEDAEDEAPEEEAEAEVIEDDTIVEESLEEGIFDKKPKFALVYKNRDNTVSAFALGNSKEGLEKKAKYLEADWRSKFEDDFNYDFQVVDLKTAYQKLTDKDEIKNLLTDKDEFIN